MQRILEILKKFGVKGTITVIDGKTGSIALDKRIDIAALVKEITVTKRAGGGARRKRSWPELKVVQN